jgi:RNA polymerase sigma factor (sigma-70 family)
MILHVCRQVLQHTQDAEDAFQATLLVLARNARSIRNTNALASWLHGVAYRTAMRAKRDAAHRRLKEQRALARSSPNPAGELAWREVQTLLHEEIQRLPEIYRAPFVLCFLEGKSRAEVAMQLTLKEGTVSSRLAAARSRLQKRLSARGVELGAVLAVGALGNSASSGTPPVVLAATVIRVAPHCLARFSASALLSPQIVALAKGVTRTMMLTKFKVMLFLVAVVCLAATGAAVLSQQRSAVPGQVPNKPQESPALSPVEGAALTDSRKSEAKPGPRAPEGATAAAAEPKQHDNPRVSTIIRLSAQPPGLTTERTTDSEFANFQKTQAALLKSRLVLNTALRRPQIAGLQVVRNQKDGVEWLETNLKVDFRLSPELMRVAMAGCRPKEQAMILNAVADTYLEEVVGSENNAKLERLEKLKDLAARYAEELRDKRKTYKDQAETVGADSWSPETGSEVLKILVKDYAKELSRVKLALVAARARLNHLEKKAQSPAKADEALSQARDQVSLLSEHGKLLSDELTRFNKTLRDRSERFDLESHKEEMAQLEATARKLRSEVEQGNINLQTPSRITLLQRAETPRE